MKALLIFFTAILLISACSATSDKSMYDKNTSEETTSVAYVNLSFNIDEQGKPVDIKVIDSKPAGTFDKAAIRALSKWTYKPKTEKGVGIKQTGLTVRLDFNAES